MKHKIAPGIPQSSCRHEYYWFSIFESPVSACVPCQTPLVEKWYRECRTTPEALLIHSCWGPRGFDESSIKELDDSTNIAPCFYTSLRAAIHPVLRG